MRKSLLDSIKPMTYLDFEKELNKTIFSDFQSDLVLNLKDLNEMSS